MDVEVFLWLAFWGLRLVGGSILLPFRRFSHQEENEAASVVVGGAVVGLILAFVALSWWWWLRVALGAYGGSLTACLLLAYHDRGT
jgi:hypothetical protein